MEDRSGVKLDKGLTWIWSSGDLELETLIGAVYL